MIDNVWDGRIVSDATLTSRINSARRALGDDGRSQSVIRTFPRRGYRFIAEVAGEDDRAGVAPSDNDLSSPNRASIAVLPFVNLSGDPEQEYFSEAMVDEIITALSRLRWMYVAARTSSSMFKGGAGDVREIGRRLGVRYVLEGSVRRSGERVRIIGQLIDAATGDHLWADRFDGRLADILDLQDRITESVVGAIEPKLVLAEIDRAKRKRPEKLDAYDYYPRALPHVHSSTKESISEGLRLLDEALAIDPDYAPASALAAWFYFYRITVARTSSIENDVAEGVRLARAALNVDTDDPRVLSDAGWVLATLGRDVETGAAAIDRAVLLSPNSALVLSRSGYVLTLVGDQETSLRRSMAAVRLGPSDSTVYRFLTGAAIACILMGRHGDAVLHTEQAHRKNEKFGPTHRILAAAYSQLGQTEISAEALLRYLELDPSITISHLQRQLPYQNAEQAEHIWGGLRKAGLPE